MKKRFLSILLALALILTVFPGAALAAEGDAAESGPKPGDTVTRSNIVYTLKDDNTWEVSLYRGTSARDKVVIPETVNGIAVTSIGESAFMEKSFATVTIPGSVTEIKAKAFSKCPNLTAVTIQSKITKTNGVETLVPLKEIGPQAFSWSEKLTSFFGNVEKIGDNAFDNCKGLTTVLIPAGLKEIGASSFVLCSNLTNVYLDGNITAVGANAFQATSKLSVVHIGSGVSESSQAQLKVGKASLEFHTGVSSILVKAPECEAAGSENVRVLCANDPTPCRLDYTETRTIPKLGHELEILAGKPATCTDTGLTEGSRCTKCGKTVTVQIVIPVLAHEWEETGKTTVKEPTCSEDGTGSVTYKCKNCSATETRENVVLPATNEHTYTNAPMEGVEEKWVPLVKPDCTKIPKPETPAPGPDEGGETGGDGETGGTARSTGTSARSTDTGDGLRVKVRFCSICQREEVLGDEVKEEMIKDPENAKFSDYIIETIPASSAHEPGSLLRYTDADGKPISCEYEGKVTAQYQCTVCGQEYSVSGVTKEAGQHTTADEPNEDNTTKPASCTEDGEYKTVCSVCGVTYAEKIPASGHTDSEPETVVIKQATCEEEGEQYTGRVICEACGEVVTEGTKEVLPKTGHTFSDGTEPEITKEATCTESGSKVTSGTCTVCGQSVSESSIIPASGHKPAAEIKESVTKEATCTEPGTKILSTVCTVCGEAIQEDAFEISPEGHEYEEKEVNGVKKMICAVCGAEKEDSDSSSGGSDSSGGDGDDSSGDDDNTIVTPTTYAVNLIRTTNGSISSSVSRAAAGETVRISVTPYAGYELDYLQVTRSGGTVSLSGQGGNEYTFIMPGSWVDIHAAFVRTTTSTSSSYRPSTPAPSSIVLPTIQTIPKAAASGQIFSDIPSTYWASGEIAWAYQRGYMGGTGYGRFTPDGSITYQQMWMVLARITGSHPANMEAARLWALENGFAEGANPGIAITRQQLVTALYRTAVLLGRTPVASGNLAKYVDSATVSAPARDSMNWAVSSGIISGTADGRLNPNGTTTRAQFAVILYRFYQRIF